MTNAPGLRRTLEIARKETRHIRRDPQQLFFAFGLPILLLFILGYAVSFDVDHISLAVVDHADSGTSHRLVEAFTAGDLFEVNARRPTMESVQPLMRAGAVQAALVIPSDFERRLERGEEAPVQLVLDGTDNNTASVAQGYATSIAFEFARKRLDRRVEAPELPLQARTQILFNPTLRSVVFIVPGLIAIILVLVAVMLTALTVAREYERGSMEQLFTTPVSGAELITGKLAPYAVLGEVQVVIVLLVGIFVFDVPFRGNLVLLFVVATIFLLGMLMQGLFISVVTRQQMLAAQIAGITTLLPALLLSGFVFPIDTMPVPIQAIAHVLPPKYFIHALRAIMVRGNGPSVVWLDAVVMGLFFGVMLVLAWWRFRRNLE